MKKQIINLSLVAITFIFSGCASYDRTEGFAPLRISSKTPERIVLKSFGSPGQRFSGVLTVDGKRQEISGETPAEYPLECSVLIGEVTSHGGDGHFGFMIERQDTPGRFYTPKINAGTPLVRGKYRFRYYAGSIAVMAER
ncbi:MAG: hypothetical protein AB9869_16735 [Verrucomicrobiia bacterium]